MRLRRLRARRYVFTLALVLGMLVAATLLAVGPGNLRALITSTATNSGDSQPSNCGHQVGSPTSSQAGSGQDCDHPCPHDPDEGNNNHQAQHPTPHPEDTDSDADDPGACEPCPPTGYGHPPGQGQGDNDKDDCAACPQAKADECS